MKKNVKILKHFEKPKEGGTYYSLLCLTGENKGLAYYLLGKRVVLGRSDQADIRVLDIKSSREHAEIVYSQNRFIITDLGAHNGIVVNDLKVKQHVLSDGDSIIIGETVFKFSKLIVEKKAELEEKPAAKVEEEVFEEEPEKKKSKKSIYILVGVILAGLLLMPEDDQVEPEGKRLKSRKEKVDQISSVAFKKKKELDKEKQKKMRIYFSRGLREFREENYFRAMSEFEHALSWSPNDPLALFYLRKTKDALNKAVEELFNTGRRDEDSLKYKKASVSYCAVIRLLYRYPKDDRYKEAQEKIKELEGKLGLEEGELECLQKIN